MSACKRTFRGRPLACFLLYLLLAATAGAEDALPNDQDTLITDGSQMAETEASSAVVAFPETPMTTWTDTGEVSSSGVATSSLDLITDGMESLTLSGPTLETPSGSSLTDAVSTEVSSGDPDEETVLTITETEYITVTKTNTVPLTTDDGNTVTTTVTDSKETVVSTEDSQIVVTETPPTLYTVVTVLSTATNLETLISESVVDGTTVTVTEISTVGVVDYTTITLPETTTTEDVTSTVVETSTEFTTATTLEGTPTVVTTTTYLTVYQTVVVSGSTTSTMPAQPSSETVSGSESLTAADTVITESFETITATGSDQCTVPIVTSTVDLTSTDTVVVFTTAVPESTTATITSTVETVTETTSIGSFADQSTGENPGTMGSDAASGTEIDVPSVAESSPAEQTPTSDETSTIASPEITSSSEAVASESSSPSAPRHRRRRRPRSLGSQAEFAESGISGTLKKRLLRSGANIEQRQAEEDQEISTITVLGETPTVTITITDNCQSSETLTSAITTVPESGTTTSSSEELTSLEVSSTENTSATGEPTASEKPTSTETLSASEEPIGTEEPTATQSAISTAEISSTESMGPSPTPTSLPQVCTTSHPRLMLITDSLTFPQAQESCRALDGSLATLRRFRAVKDALDILGGCNATEAWISPDSINTVTRPQCFALSQDQWYEPEDCLMTTRQVLCAKAA